MEKVLMTVDAAHLRRFVARVFEKLQVPIGDAERAADVLIQADLRGVESHGVARLEGHYVKGLQAGIIDPAPEIKVVNETPATAFIDGGRGLGMVVSIKAMEHCIRKAEQSGGAFVAVSNSNHYGMAAYYSMMALPHDMIGISITQAAPRVVPTNGRKAMFGTNPISVAVPAGEERPFVLDMATSVASRGKLEVAMRKDLPIPLGWALDKEGRPTTSAEAAVEGQASLPLGGLAETAGYKGYGLALVVDILSGVLTGFGYGAMIEGLKVGHFFAALKIDAFRPVDEFESMMDDMIRGLKASPKMEGHDRIYIPGEIEYECEEERRQHGIPLYPQVVENLKRIADKIDIPFDLQLQ